MALCRFLCLLCRFTVSVYMLPKSTVSVFLMVYVSVHMLLMLLKVATPARVDNCFYFCRSGVMGKILLLWCHE